jgi:O-antigen/teichoic acid export membrane protein
VTIDAEPTRETGGIAATATATMAVQVATYALVFGVSILVARGLGPVGRGQYYLPVTAAAIAVVVANPGIVAATTFVVAERHATLRQAAAAATLLAPISGVIGAVGLVVLYVLTKDSLLKGVSWEAFVVAPALLPIQIHVLAALNVFTVGGRVVRAQFAQLAGAVLQVALLLPPVIAGRLTLLYALATYAVFVAAPWLLLVWWSRPFAPLRPEFDRALLRRMVAFGLKLQLGQVFFYLLFRADTLLINLMLGAREVGIYSLAVVLGEAVMLLTMPVVLAALPVQTAMSNEAAGAFSFKAARFNGAFALVLSLIVAATMWIGVPLLYGSDFGGAYAALVTLLPGIVALSVIRPLSSWLVRQDRPWLISGLGAAAFAANAALNLALLPAIGIVGASLASSIAYIGLAAALIGWGLRCAGLTAREALVPTAADVATARRAAAAQAGRLVRRRGSAAADRAR